MTRKVALEPLFILCSILLKFKVSQEVDQNDILTWALKYGTITIDHLTFAYTVCYDWI